MTMPPCEPPPAMLRPPPRHSYSRPGSDWPFDLSEVDRTAVVSLALLAATLLLWTFPFGFSLLAPVLAGSGIVLAIFSKPSVWQWAGIVGHGLLILLLLASFVGRHVEASADQQRAIEGQRATVDFLRSIRDGR